MTLIKNYNYSENEVSSLVVDNTNGEFLWVGFKQDSLGKCALQKVSANNLLQKYFDIDLTVDEIKDGNILGSYIYLALDDSSLIGRRYSLSNPLTTSTDYSLPAGITEAPIKVLAYGSYVYFLLPGSSSGTNAKIIKFSLAGTFIETIDLVTITNAQSFTIDTATDEFWVITYKSLSQYVRVYNDGTWNYTANT